MSRNENASTDDVKGRTRGQREGRRQRQVGGGGAPFCSVLCTEGAAAAMTGDGYSELL